MSGVFLRHFFKLPGFFVNHFNDLYIFFSLALTYYVTLFLPFIDDAFGLILIVEFLGCYLVIWSSGAVYKICRAIEIADWLSYLVIRKGLVCQYYTGCTTNSLGLPLHYFAYSYFFLISLFLYSLFYCCFCVLSESYNRTRFCFAASPQRWQIS